MKKLILSMAAIALLSTTLSAPAHADRWGRHPHGGDPASVLLWPLAAVLTLPAAIIGGVAKAAIPPPVVSGYPAPRVFEGPGAYAGPRAYYEPEPEMDTQEYPESRDYYNYPPPPRGHHYPRYYEPYDDE